MEHDLIDQWTLIAANIAIVGGLIGEIIWRRRESKGQKEELHKQLKNQDDLLAAFKKEIKVLKEKSERDTYDRCRDDMMKLVFLLLEKPELNKCWEKMVKAEKWNNVSFELIWEQLTTQEKSYVNYYSLWFDVLERLIRLRNEKYIDNDRWQHYRKIIETFTENWLFGYTLELGKDWYTKEILDEVKDIYAKIQARKNKE